jgi:hypothetical protein
MIVCEGTTLGGALAQLLPDAETAVVWMRSIEEIATKPIVWEVWQTDQDSLRDAESHRRNNPPQGEQSNDHDN